MKPRRVFKYGSALPDELTDWSRAHCTLCAGAGRTPVPHFTARTQTCGRCMGHGFVYTPDQVRAYRVDRQPGGRTVTYRERRVLV